MNRRTVVQQGSSLAVGGNGNVSLTKGGSILVTINGQKVGEYTNVTGGLNGGLNGTYLLNATTVHKGGPDLLPGGSGTDLFFVGVCDVLLGRRRNETVITV